MLEAEIWVLMVGSGDWKVGAEIWVLMVGNRGWVCWVLDLGSWVLCAGCWRVDPESWVLPAGCYCAVGAGCQILNAGCLKLEAGC